MEAVLALQQPQIGEVDLFQANWAVHIQWFLRFLRYLPLQSHLLFLKEFACCLFVTTFDLFLLFIFIFEHFAYEPFTYVFLADVDLWWLDWLVK